MNKIKKTLLLLLFLPLFAHAVGEPYTQEKQDALNKAGKPILVVVHADWCGTCRAQEQILEQLLPQAEFRGVSTLRIDFDAQKQAVRSFGVRYQSTLIVFKGGKEVTRVTAETDRERIAELLRKAL